MEPHVGWTMVSNKGIHYHGKIQVPNLFQLLQAESSGRSPMDSKQTMTHEIVQVGRRQTFTPTRKTLSHRAKARFLTDAVH